MEFSCEIDVFCSHSSSLPLPSPPPLVAKMSPLAFRHKACNAMPQRCSANVRALSPMARSNVRRQLKASSLHPTKASASTIRPTKCAALPSAKTTTAQKFARSERLATPPPRRPNASVATDRSKHPMAHAPSQIHSTIAASTPIIKARLASPRNNCAMAPNASASPPITNAMRRRANSNAPT